VNQQPITSFEYKNVGVNIDITPRVHDAGEVTLDLKLDVSSLAPSLDVAGVQGLPTFNSRTVTSRIRLRDGETTILAGLISDVERTLLSGLPGLSDVPILGRLFSRNRREVMQTDIVMTLRPHIVIPPEVTEEDERAFPLSSDSTPVLYESTGTSSSSGGGGARPTESPRIEPIRPPQPVGTPTPPLPMR
jgi:general secretion pathway protein D